MPIQTLHVGKLEDYLNYGRLKQKETKKTAEIVIFDNDN